MPMHPRPMTPTAGPLLPSVVVRMAPVSRPPCASGCPRPAGSRVYADYDKDAVELIKNIKVAQSIGFSLSELVPIAAAYVAGRLDDGEQRVLLEAKLAEIEERQDKLRQMSEFLRSKLSDLPAGD